MQIEVCMAKIHNATVTQANPEYKGSITICAKLMKAAGIRPYQLLHINNGRNGVHWETYAMPGKDGEICLNGWPPSHHFKKGDRVIILAIARVTPEEYEITRANVVFVDENNQRTQKESHSLGDLHRNMLASLEEAETP